MSDFLIRRHDSWRQDPWTDAQADYIDVLCGEVNMDPVRVLWLVLDKRPPVELTKGQASLMINWLLRRRERMLRGDVLPVH